MKKITSVLLFLALIAALLVSCSDSSSGGEAADPLETVSVENFLKSYYAVDFMDDGISLIPGNMYNQLQSKLETNNTTVESEEIDLSTYTDSNDPSRIKNCLSSVFRDDESDEGYGITRLTSQKGTITYTMEKVTADSSATGAAAQSGLIYTTELKNCDVTLSYRAMKKDDNSNWSYDASAEVVNGRVAGSYTEKTTLTGAANGTEEATVYSNIKLNVTLDEDGVFESASSSSAVSYKDIKFVVTYTQGDTQTSSITSAEYNGTAFSKDDVKRINNIIYGI